MDSWEIKFKNYKIFKNKIDDIKRAHERELNMIKSPFLFLFKDASAGAMEENEPEILLSIYEAHPKEKEASKTVDSVLKPIISKSAFGEFFWRFLFVVAYAIYFFMTLILCIYKPEFFNLVIITLSFYLLPNVDLRIDMNSPRSKKKVIRVCVFLIFVSFFWDIIWLLIHWTSWWKREKYDGDLELGMRRFCLIGTIVSLVLRIFIFFIFWRTSLDYFKFMEVNMLSGLKNEKEKLVFLRG